MKKYTKPFIVTAENIVDFLAIVEFLTNPETYEEEEFSLPW